MSESTTFDTGRAEQTAASTHAPTQASSREDATVSVIVPVYNVEPYLARCVESLLRQTLEDLEFIFIDDCGSDDSLQKLRGFEGDDDRVRIIQNDCRLGAGASRNRGIDAARGRYLSFVDADDWVTDDFFEKLYAKAKSSGCEIVKGQFVHFDVEDGSTVPVPVNVNERIANGISLGKPLYRFFSHEHNGTLYARRLFENPDVRYGTTDCSEDSLFLLAACLEAQGVVIEDSAVYHYCRRPDSASRTVSVQRYYGSIDSLRDQIELLREHGFDDDAYEFIGARIAYYTGEYFLGEREAPRLREQRDEYARSVLACARTVPDFDRLVEEIPELEVLVEYGTLIPMRNGEVGQLFLIRMREWNAFLAAHPDVAERYWDHYASIIRTTNWTARREQQA